MKWFIQIIAVYLFVLALLPCGDGGGGMVEALNHWLEVEHEHAVADHQHSNDCSDDDCSPFCFCSCCSISIVTPSAVVVSEIVKAEFTLQPSFYSDFIPSTFDFSVWQPPRFS